jgi:predicted ester cyclase
MLKVVLALIFSALAAIGSGCCQTQSRTLSENKAIVLRSESELWSKGNLAVADQLYSPDFVCHFVVGPEWKGIRGIKDEVANHRRSFPDWHEKVDDIVAEGNEVVIRFTSTGTQLGEFQGIAPTGEKVKIQEMAIFRLSHGKIVEQWGMPDIHGLLAQLRDPGPTQKRAGGGS